MSNLKTSEQISIPLRHKVLAIVGGTVLILVVVLLAVSRALILTSFKDLERDHARDNINRAVRALDMEIAALNELLMDWTVWDDTYQFIQDENAAYVESNIVETLFTNSRLSLIHYINNAGEVVLERGFDLVEVVDAPVPEDIRPYLVPGRKLSLHEIPESSVSGIILLGTNPLLVASQPILTSEGQGPIMGTLIMARTLDDSGLQALSNTALMNLSLHRLDAPDLQDHIRKIRSLFTTGESFITEEIDSETIGAYALLKDIDGNAVLVLQATLPRSIYAHGVQSVNQFIFSLLLLGFVVCLVTLALLQSQVVSRLSRLSHSVSQIAVETDHTSRVEEAGRDEIAALARRINSMLASLGGAYQDRVKLVEELQNALDEVQTLEGLLPICASCKKIQNDENEWQSLEVYISSHAEVKFSHGICPECRARLYPETLPDATS